MAPRHYPAVCAVRRVEGHERCERALDVDLDGGAVAHLCAHNVVVAACLAAVTAADIAPRLDAIGAAAGTDPAPEGGA